MMISQFFVLSQRGDNIVFRDCKLPFSLPISSSPLLLSQSRLIVTVSSDFLHRSFSKLIDLFDLHEFRICSHKCLAEFSKFRFYHKQIRCCCIHQMILYMQQKSACDLIGSNQNFEDMYRFSFATDRAEVPKGSTETFFRKVKFWKEDGNAEAPPIFVGILVLISE